MNVDGKPLSRRAIATGYSCVLDSWGIGLGSEGMLTTWVLGGLLLEDFGVCGFGALVGVGGGAGSG